MIATEKDVMRAQKAIAMGFTYMHSIVCQYKSTTYYRFFILKNISKNTDTNPDGRWDGQTKTAFAKENPGAASITYSKFKKL